MIIYIANSGASPVITIPTITGVVPATYEFIITAVSDSDSAIEAHYTLYIELKSPCEQTVLTMTPLGTIQQRTGLPAYTYQVQALDTVSQS